MRKPSCGYFEGTIVRQNKSLLPDLKKVGYRRWKGEDGIQKRTESEFF